MAKIQQLLSNFPDQAAAKRLVENLSFGHSLEYKGPIQSRWSSNLKSVFENPKAAQEKIDKEVAMGRIAGPFNSVKQSGLNSLIVSPIGLVPKSDKGVRLIHHLSHPWGEGINAYIDDEASKVVFAKFDQAIKLASIQGKGALMAKFDVKSAYRLLPVRESDFKFLGMHLEGRVYIDKMLPMGAKISASHWEAFGRVWDWLVNQHPAFSGQTCRYMDDMLCVFDPHSDPTPSVEAVFETCAEIGLPLAEEKTVLPTTHITFLGLSIDSETQTIGVPLDKISRAQVELEKLIRAKKTKVRQILSIAGLLNFICKAIPAGRPFLRRLFDSVKGRAKHMWVPVPEEVKLDARTWLSFLEKYNGCTVFPPLVEVRSTDLNLFTDASLRGYGIVCGTKWVMEAFPPFEDPQPSMT